MSEKRGITKPVITATKRIKATSRKSG